MSAGTYIGVCHRDALRPRCCTGCEQHQRDIARFNRFVRRPILLVSREGEETGLRIGCGRQFENADAARERHTGRRRVDPSRCDQCTRSQITEISVQFLSPIGWVHGGACRARRYGENRHRHLRTVRQHHGHPITTRYPHGPQRAPHLIDVLIETAVGQRGTAGSKYYRRVGNSLGLMFQDVRQARKRS